MAELDLGRVVGLSAYEVAVENGYTGNEPEWLESLRQDTLQYTEQTLTDAQKAQARENIDVYSKDETDEKYLAQGDVDLEELLTYGIQRTVSSSSVDWTRIGNSSLHRTLPIHSLMRGCLFSDDGEVNSYLPDGSWLESTRDGSEGQVMVEMPYLYYKYDNDGTTESMRISRTQFPGYMPFQKQYVSAYEATVDRTDNLLCSVVNTSAQYRGGNNNSEWDDTYRSLCGIPATTLTLEQFRTYARNRGNSGEYHWNCYHMEAHKMLAWLFMIEFATTNSQKAVNNELTDDGYKQGGLGNGVTTLSSSVWSEYNNYHPLIPCGTTDELGNNTGEIAYDIMQDDTLIVSVNVPRYRGIENPFGHLYKQTDGIIVNVQADDDGGLSELYITSKPNLFSSTSYEGYDNRGNLARVDGYIKTIIGGENADILPSVVGGSSSTYYTDSFFTDADEGGSGLRGVRFSGPAHYGSYVGFVFAGALYALTVMGSDYGSRLCYIPD